MVGLMKSKQSEILNGCGKYVPDKSLNFLRMDVESMWLQLKPFVLLSNILFLDLLLHSFSLVPWETQNQPGLGVVLDKSFFNPFNLYQRQPGA